MSEAGLGGTEREIEAVVPLGDVEPAGSRGMRRRSAVAVVGDRVVVGTADGRVRAVSTATGEIEWTAGLDGSAVALAAGPGDTVVAGTRGEDGTVAALEAASGAVRWRHRTADDLGTARGGDLLSLPYVVDLAGDDERVYAAARRYERDGENRSFESRVYAFGPDGSPAWTHRTDASPIAIDFEGARLAVAYNRCPGDHQCGLVVLDAESGTPRFTWDPGTPGDRRVGDVSLLADGVAVASHGDYRGYRLGEGGRERWAVDLATPIETGGETLYAYPNRVHATRNGVVFITGNSYPEAGRKAEGRHPNEHTIRAFAPDGAERWRADLEGWAGEFAAGETIAVPRAQHLRDRDPGVHGLGLFDLTEGPLGERPFEGIATAAAVGEGRVAAVEEPVKYHDGEETHGEYRLHVLGQ